MAYKTVVNAPLFIQVADAFKRMHADKGPFRLAMLVSSATGYGEKWNVVVSAEWLDRLGTRKAVQYISRILTDTLGKNSLSRIERISVMSANDPWINAIVTDLGELVTPGTAYRFQSSEFVDTNVDEAILLAATPPKTHVQRFMNRVAIRRG